MAQGPMAPDPQPQQLLMTRATEPPTARGSRASGHSLPPALLAKIGRRLQVVCIVVGGVYLFGWLVANVMAGSFIEEFDTPFQWGGPVVAIAVSVTLWSIVQWSGLSPRSLVRLGLFYEVILAWCIPVGSYYGTFTDVPVSEITGDLVGHSAVSLWMLFFTVLVPARPASALLALTLCAVATPATMWLLIAIGDAPAMTPGQFLAAFVYQYVVMLIVAYLAARMIYTLGRDVRAAQIMGSYQLLERLGAGGMGEVWRARHRMLARPAALKFIRTRALGDRPEAVEAAMTRFDQEAQITASLQSPHTVELYDFGISDDERLYYVMELLEGINLETLVQRYGPLPAERAIHILMQACSSLDEAHRRGLVHRDIKPANLVVCEQAFEPDFVKVLDFGLARRRTAVPDGDALTESASAVTGTPAYLAPELALDPDGADGRADLYALGCVGFWLLTGRLVFEAATATDMILAHVNQQPEAPSQHTELPIPPQLDAALLDCLAKAPADRPANAGVLRDRLAEIPLKTPWTAKRAAAWWTRHRPQPTAGDA